MAREAKYLRSVEAFVFNSETTKETVESLLGKKTRNVVATPGGDRLTRSITLTGSRRARRGARRAPNPFRRKPHPAKGPAHAFEGRPDARRTRLPARRGGPRRRGSKLCGIDSSPGAGARTFRPSSLSRRRSRERTWKRDTGAPRFSRSRRATKDSGSCISKRWVSAFRSSLPPPARSDEIVRHESTGFLVPPGRLVEPRPPHRVPRRGPGAPCAHERRGLRSVRATIRGWEASMTADRAVSRRRFSARR